MKRRKSGISQIVAGGAGDEVKLEKTRKRLKGGGETEEEEKVELPKLLKKKEEEDMKEEYEKNA